MFWRKGSYGRFNVPAFKIKRRIKDERIVSALSDVVEIYLPKTNTINSNFNCIILLLPDIFKLGNMRLHQPIREDTTNLSETI